MVTPHLRVVHQMTLAYIYEAKIYFIVSNIYMSSQKFKKKTVTKFERKPAQYHKEVILEKNTINENVEVDLKLELGGQQLSTRKHRYSVLRKQNKHYREQFLFMILDKMYYRRKSYCFQVIKQFFLFPDQTISSNVSVSSYDPIFFHDENLHTFIKIYETKELQAKLWAFLNLKMLKLREKLHKFTGACEKVQQKAIKLIKSDSFHTINQYSIHIKTKDLNIRGQNKNDTVKKVSSDNSQKKETRIIHNVPKYTPSTTTRYEYEGTKKPTIQYRQVSREKSPTIKTVKQVQIGQQTQKNRRIIYPSEKNTYVSDTIKEVREVHHHQTRTDRPPVVYRIQHRSPQYRTQHRRSPQYRKQEQKRVITHNICPSCSNKPTEKIISKGQNQELVHTVEGNCNINIYNHCNFYDKQKQEKIEAKEKSRGSGIQKSTIVQPKSPVSLQTNKVMEKCCCWENRSRTGLMMEEDYCIEERLEYLKKLETLSERMKINKS